MGLLVLTLVAIVVAETWFDWRDAKRSRPIPEWGKGVALGGLAAVSIAASSAFASVWIRDEAGDWTGGFGAPRFWLEIAFALAMLGVIVYGIRKKRLRLMFLVSCALIVVFALGMAL